MTDDNEIPGGIAKSGGYGKTVLGLQAGNKSNTGSMQVEFPDAHVYTIGFNLVPKGAIEFVLKCEAFIQFGVEGNTITRRVSVVNGMSISGPAQAIAIRLEDHTDISGDPTAINNYDVDITVTPGTRAFGHQPPTLEQQSAAFLIPGSSQVDVPVPPDAGVTSVFITWAPSGGGTPGSIIVVESQGGIIQTKVWDAKQLHGWIPVSPGTDTISVINEAPGIGGQNIAVTVTLGIDG